MAMLQLGAYQTIEEKTKGELHKKGEYCFDQVLEAVPQNSNCMTSYLSSHSSVDCAL